MSDPADYLGRRVDLANADVVSAIDELSLWSATFGLLLLEHVPLGRGLRVLDVGCGTGFPLLELAERLGSSCEVVALDPWEQGLERARFKARVRDVRNVRIERGDAAAMPFEDACFDLVVSNLGLNNFADPDAAAAECRRVMKPGATLALTTNLVGHMAEFYEAFEATLRRRDDPAAVEALDRHVRHRATVEGVRDLCRRAGLEVTRVVERQSTMRFLDGAALLRHSFIRLGFLEAWEDVVEPAAREEIFSALEADLDRHASERGGLALTIPMAYVEARPVASTPRPGGRA